MGETPLEKIQQKQTDRHSRSSHRCGCSSCCELSRDAMWLCVVDKLLHLWLAFILYLNLDDIVISESTKSRNDDLPSECHYFGRHLRHYRVLHACSRHSAWMGQCSDQPLCQGCDTVSRQLSRIITLYPACLVNRYIFIWMKQNEN